MALPDPEYVTPTPEDWQAQSEATPGNIATDALKQTLGPPLHPVMPLAGINPYTPNFYLPTAVRAHIKRRVAEEADVAGQRAAGELAGELTPGKPPTAVTPEVERVGGSALAQSPRGDFGLGGIQRRLLTEADKAGLPPELVTEYEKVSSQRRQLAESIGSEMGQIQAQMQGLLTTQQNVERQFQSGISEAKERMSRAGKRAQYPSLTLDEINSYEGTIDDKYATTEQKRAAQLALKRAEEIDPNRLFEDGGQRILAAIAVGLGAYTNVMTKGRTPNYGLQMVNNAIERDIAAQKANFEHAGRAYARERQVYADMYTEFENSEQALAATRALLTEGAAAVARKYNHQDLGLALDEQATRLKMEVYRQNGAKRVDDLAKAGAIARERAQLQQEQYRTELMAEGRREAVKLKEQQALPGGTAWIDPNAPHVSPTQAKPVFKLMESYNAVQPLLDQISAWRKQHGAEWLDRVDMSEVRAWHSQLVSVMRQVQQTGAHLSKEEKANIDRAISGDPTDLGFILPALQATKKALRAEYEGRLKAYGMKMEDEPSLPLMAPLPARE